MGKPKSGGTRAGLWRGAKGHERMSQGDKTPWEASWGKTSRTGVKAKVEEVAKKPIRLLTQLTTIL